MKFFIVELYATYYNLLSNLIIYFYQLKVLKNYSICIIIINSNLGLGHRKGPDFDDKIIVKMINKVTYKSINQ